MIERFIIICAANTNLNFSIIAEEPPKPEPRICPCQNGGVCVEDDLGVELNCLCQPDFSGRVCDVTSRRSRRTGIFSSMLVIPLTGILLLLIAGAIFLFIRKRPLYVFHFKRVVKTYLKFNKLSRFDLVF